MDAAFATFAPLRGAMPSDDDSCRRRRVRGRPCLRRPRWLPHPVVAMGRAITWAEGRLRRVFPQTPAGTRAAGLVLAVALPLACGLLTWGILHLCGMVHSGLRFVAEAWASYQILAACELRRRAWPWPARSRRAALSRRAKQSGSSWDATRLFSTSRASRAPLWKRWRRTRATASSRRFSTL